jgi:hypothetical protein
MILDIKKYDDFFTTGVTGLTFDKIIDQINKSKYGVSKYKKHDLAEDDEKISPPLVTVFYELFEKKGKIPTYREFATTWVNDAKNELIRKGYELTKKTIKGLYKRASNTYPSTIRDATATLMLKEIFKDCKVIYNKELDLYYQIDVLLIKNDNFYGLKLYTDTQRAKRYLIKKPHRNVKNFENVHYIPVAIEIYKNENIKKDDRIIINTSDHICDKNCDKDCRKKCDPIYLYGKNLINIVNKEIEKNDNK